MEAILSDEQWHVIDEHLFANKKLPVVRALRQWTRLSLNEIQEVMLARYTILREQFPERFSCTHEEYWYGWGGDPDED